MAKITYQPLEAKHIKSFHAVLSQIMREDLTIYSKSQQEMFLKDYYSEKRLTYFVENESYEILTAISDDEVVGILFGDKTFGGVGFVTWLGVRKDMRKQGIGARLIFKYENYCKGQNAHLIEVYTFSHITKFYTDHGFYQIGRREKGYFGIENVIMDKDI